MLKNILKNIVVVLLRFEARLIIWKYKPKIIAVTGSVGKTSAKDAIALVLGEKFDVRKSEKSYNSELGVPLTIIGTKSAWNNFVEWILILIKGIKVFFKKSDYPKWLILEMGVGKPKDMEHLVSFIKPDVAVMTSLGEIPVHVERFNGPEEIAKEKAKIFKNIKDGGYAILNGDDKNVLSFKDKIKANVIVYGFNEEGSSSLADKFDLIASNYRFAPEGITFKVDYKGNIVPVRLHNVFGRHYIYSALSALAVVVSQGMNLVEAVESLVGSKAPPGRLNLLEGIKNSKILDDTYNSSPLALEAALETLKNFSVEKGGKKIAVLGDMLELGKFTIDEHKKAGKLVKEVGVDILFTVGPRAKFIAEEARQSGFSPKNIFEFSTADEVKLVVQEQIKEGDLILVKGSQGMRMERIVEEIMAHPEFKEQLLARQEKEWLNK